ncbi:hypothetical protein BK026_08615 [Alteromonas sp. V450]|uniref:WbuC family cupin fold metalloprotein n=1 Tax=Alteromonas sp. V450 TaxID=1912139 RepID=UPI0008FF2091|nr:WbuC family cupin fold metalloprotein [Alteromonas sp. V450]OJF68850.1 hypothetical protein BK026_08615 [Alteromonas sp. V450]
MNTLKRFDRPLFDALKKRAEQNPRSRANHNIHSSYRDQVQRLFIAMMPDSYVRPHRHQQSHKWEFFMVLEGELELLFFDEHGVLTERLNLEAGGENSGVEIPTNVWHATICRNPVVFMEVKQGPYDESEDKGFASWAPEEGASCVPDFLSSLKNAPVGKSFASEHDVSQPCKDINNLY